MILNSFKILVSTALFLSLSSPVFADAASAVGKIGAFGNVDLGGIVRNLILIALFAASVFFLVQIVVGGVAWINSAGDPKALESARGRIMNSVIGLVIVVAAFGITLIVTNALGVNVFQSTITIGQ